MKIFNIIIKEFDSYGTPKTQHPAFYVASTSTMDAEKRTEKQLPSVKGGCTRVFKTTVLGETSHTGLFVQMYQYDCNALADAEFSFDNFDPHENEFDAIDFRFIKKSKIDQVMQREYAHIDGHGHHFASYDGKTHECTINGTDYYFFRVN